MRLDCRAASLRELVESVLDEISDSLIDGDTVKISSFGSFSIRDKAQRVGRNLKTGEAVPILPRRVLGLSGFTRAERPYQRRTCPPW